MVDQLLLLVLVLLLHMADAAILGLASRRHVVNVLLADVHLLHAVLRKEAGPIDAAHVALQEATVGGADHVDHVARLDA